MKRLIRKSTNVTIPNIRDEVELTEDSTYQSLDMNQLSRPENRDGVVLVDVKNDKLYMGLNGETHARLMEQYYGIDQNSDDTKLDIDSYVVPGIYLRNFLDHETIILYSYVNGAEEVITQQKPGVIVYEENYWDETLLRLAKIRK